MIQISSTIHLGISSNQKSSNLSRCLSPKKYERKLICTWWLSSFRRLRHVTHAPPITSSLLSRLCSFQNIIHLRKIKLRNFCLKSKTILQLPRCEAHSGEDFSKRRNVGNIKASAFSPFDFPRSAWKKLCSRTVWIQESIFVIIIIHILPGKKCLQSQRYCHKHFTTFSDLCFWNNNMKRVQLLSLIFVDTEWRIISFNASTVAWSAKSSIQSLGWMENWKMLRCEGDERNCYQDFFLPFVGGVSAIHYRHK